MEHVVIGATGASGSALIEQLLHNKHYTKVTALLRKATFDDHPKLNQVVVDFDHLENYRDYIKGDVAFSCMGTTAKTAGSKEAQWIVDHDYQYNFAKLAKENGIPHFVLLSSKGADPNSSFFYLKMKGTLDKEVLDLDFEKLFIFSPGMCIVRKSAV